MAHAEGALANPWKQLRGVGKCAQSVDVDADNLFASKRSLLTSKPGKFELPHSCTSWEQMVSLLDGISDQAVLGGNPYLTLLHACGRRSLWHWGLALLGRMEALQLTPDVRCQNVAISACARSKHWEAGVSIFQSLKDLTMALNAVSYNAAIHACTQASRWQHSLATLCDMQLSQMVPDIVTYNTTLNSCEKGSKWQQGVALVAAMQASAVAPDLHCYSTLLSACAKSGDWQRNLEYFADMLEKGLKPDVFVYSALLTACQRGTQWARGLEILGAMRGACLDLDQINLEIAVTLCEVGGHWGYALALMEEMRQKYCSPTVVSYIALIRASENYETQELQQGGIVPELASLKEELFKSVRKYAFEILQDEGVQTVERASPSQAMPGSSPSTNIYLVYAIDMLHKHGKLDTELEASFRERIYAPVLDVLQQLGHHRVSGMPVIPPARPVRGGIRTLAMHAGLGTYFTTDMLGALGLASGVSLWLSRAQATVWSALQASFPTAAQLPYTAIGRQLRVWVSFSVLPQPMSEDGMPLRLQSSGRVVAHGRHPWEQGEVLLPPIYAYHDRAQHAERRALLQVAQLLTENGAPGMSPVGTVRLYAVHTPCISCLAVFSQFKALFPRVRLTVAFASWQETREQIVRLMQTADNKRVP